MNDLDDIKHAIEDGIRWLEDALRYTTEDVDALDGWPALSETATKIATVLTEARKLLPLHPEIEAAITEQRHERDDHDLPESLGLP